MLFCLSQNCIKDDIFIIVVSYKQCSGSLVVLTRETEALVVTYSVAVLL